MLKHLRERREEGFTLIELLIVIIILGILSAVVVLAINAIRDRGNDSACRTEAEQIRVALAGYYSDGDPTAYPASFTTLNASGYLDDPADAAVWSYTPITQTQTNDFYNLQPVTDGSCDGSIDADDLPLSPTNGVD